MVTYRGYKTQVLYGDESSYGSGSTPSQVVVGRINTLTINKNNILIRSVGLGEGRNETNVQFGNFDCSWSMDYQAADFTFLRYAIGSQAGSGSTAYPYYIEERDFMDYTSGSANGMKSFGLEVGSLDITSGSHETETLSGCIINTAGISLAVGDTVRVICEGFAKTSTSGTQPSTFTADSTKPWIFAQGNLRWGTSGSSGSAVARVTSATININNNFDPEVGRGLGSRFVQAAEPGLRKYDWSATVKMSNAMALTLRDHFYGQENSPNYGVLSSEPTFYDLTLDLSEGSASTNKNAQILLENCAINDISKPINIGDNIIELTVNGTAKAAKTSTVHKLIKWWNAT